MDPRKSTSNIDDPVVELGSRGRVTISFDAHDPDGGPLAQMIHWGDEESPDAEAPLIGHSAEHMYAFAPVDSPYTGCKGDR